MKLNVKQDTSQTVLVQLTFAVAAIEHARLGSHTGIAEATYVLEDDDTTVSIHLKDADGTIYTDHGEFLFYDGREIRQVPDHTSDRDDAWDDVYE